jgi:hypothetical protein
MIESKGMIALQHFGGNPGPSIFALMYSLMHGKQYGCSHGVVITLKVRNVSAQAVQSTLGTNSVEDVRPILGFSSMAGMPLEILLFVGAAG